MDEAMTTSGKMEDMRVKCLDDGSLLLTVGMRKKSKGKDNYPSYETKEYAYESVEKCLKAMKGILMEHSHSNGKKDKMAKYMKE